MLCEHGRQRIRCKECGALRSASTGGIEASARSAGRVHTRAREAAKPVQGVRGLSDLRAREAAKQVQGVRGQAHLRAREAAKRVQGVRGGHICEHGRQRSRCKECGGRHICEHGRVRQLQEAARLATRRLPCSAPPSTPSPRFWWSARTWRTRARRSSDFHDNSHSRSARTLAAAGWIGHDARPRKAPPPSPPANLLFSFTRTSSRVPRTRASHRCASPSPPSLASRTTSRRG